MLTIAGTRVMESSQATNMPNATKKPKTWTGGISAIAREAKPTAEVSEVKSIGT